MSQKIKSVLYSALPFVFWIGLWELSSQLINSEFIIPGIIPTAEALWILLGESEFYVAILFSLLRVLIGLTLGVALGVFVAVISYKFKPVRKIFTPAVSVIKSTPVASFIVILWIMMSGDSLAIFVSFLMVFPIVWQNTIDSFAAVDPQLLEVSSIYGFSNCKKIRLVYFPILLKFLIPAIITSVGLAWKSEIAAEIIAYTSRSIGYLINESKTLFDTPKIFALTLVIIIFSVILEFVVKKLLGRIKI